jgi:hypothetical protein
MKKLVALIILGCTLLSGHLFAMAAPAGSSWPSLDADAGQSNYNSTEKTMTTKNVLKLKVLWSARISDQSYPVVSDGKVYVPVASNNKVHLRALDATTGKPLALYPKDARGGVLVSGGTIYLAGHVLQAVDVAGGQKIFQINGQPPLRGSTFVDPQGDGKVIYAGFYSGANSSIYTVDPTSNKVLIKLPSTSAFGTIASGHILTNSTRGSIFYDESSGRALARPPYLGSYWFAGSNLAYTVASVKGKVAALYAFDGTGRRIWSHVVGPVLTTHGADWAHAVSPDAVYVQTLRPDQGVQAFDPLSGRVLWTRHIADVQSIALTSKLVFVLTYGLGHPVRVVALKPTTGAVVAGIMLSSGYFAFGEPNGLIVADGMVFIRAVGPSGPQLVAMGL